MSKVRVWVVSELFYPDEASTGYIMTSIAKSLGEHYEVHVICGPAGYDKLTNEKAEENFSFTIHRLKALNFDKNNIIGRLIRLILLSFGMFFKGLFSISRRDSVLIVTNPAFAIPLFSILKLIKGFNYKILVHDVFPENLISGGVISSKSNILYKILAGCFNWSYQKASQLIVLGRDMKEVMNKKVKSKVDISIVENWADLTAIQPELFLENEIITQNSLENKIVFLFAGNIGRLQGLDFLFEVIKNVKNDIIHFAFIGDGALLPDLKEIVAVNQMQNVTFLGTYPRSKQKMFLNACHFGLVTLDQNMYGLGVPSKSYNIMAAGKPIFFIGDKMSEIALMVKEHKCGMVFDKREIQSILEFFNSVSINDIPDFQKMGEISRELAQSRYSKEFILSRFDDILRYDD